MAQTIRELFEGVSNGYGDLVREPTKGNVRKQRFTSAAVDIVQSIIGREDLVVSASMGQGNWADVPWIAIFNPENTTTATDGLYVVYLFSSERRSWYLCQGQGVTRVRDEFGRSRRDELHRRAALVRERVPEYRKVAKAGPISLKGRTPLAKDYDDAVAYSIEYAPTSLPSNDKLANDLVEMVLLYDLLLARGGTDNLDTAMDLADEGTRVGASLEERRRYVRHLRIERNATLAKKVKNALGYRCQACGFDFETAYGTLGVGFIEAHHKVPLHLLPEGKPVSLDPVEDFHVLCANCHRMVHRESPPLSVDELRQRLKPRS